MVRPGKSDHRADILAKRWQGGIIQQRFRRSSNVVSGFCVGVLVGMTGVGGGSLMTPVLILLFGVNPATAVGTDLLFAATTKTVGTLIHGVSRTIDWLVVGRLAAGSVPATAVTLLALSVLDFDSAEARRAITITLAGVLGLTSMALFFSKQILLRHANYMRELDTKSISLFTIALGALVGMLVTATSVGAGAIGVIALVLLYPQLPTVRIVGSDIAHAVPLTLLAGSGHWLLGSIDWDLLLTLVVGSIPGVVIGSYFAGRTADYVLRMMLAVVLIIVAVRLVL
jgi:uncharacterized membrane protein YfcA